MKREKVVELKRVRRYLAEVNEDTGELVYYPLRKRSLGKGWIALYQSALKIIAMEQLTGETYKVLLFLLSELDFENYIRVSQAKVSEVLGLKPSNVSRAIRSLLERDIIREGPRAGMNKTYRLNPYIGMKGTNRNAVSKEFNELENRRKQEKE